MTLDNSAVLLVSPISAGLCSVVGISFAVSPVPRSILETVLALAVCILGFIIVTLGGLAQLAVVQGVGWAGVFGCCLQAILSVAYYIVSRRAAEP